MSIFKIIKINTKLTSTRLDFRNTLSGNKYIFKTNSQPLNPPKSKDNYTQNLDTNKKTYNIISKFYSKIKLIRKNYHIKNSRKNNIDSLVKKVKSNFLRAVYECLKFCLHSFVNRLPQSFIINTKIESNKTDLNKTLEEIYNEFKILPNYETLLGKNMIQKGKERFLYILYKSKVKDIYKEYLKSDFYSNEKYEIEKKRGFGVAKLFDYVATNICEYFLFNKGNDKRIGLEHNNNSFLKFNIVKINDEDNENNK